jgi:Protein of unknown function (DUF1553)/Protein of unknown function (DUF1549)
MRSRRQPSPWKQTLLLLAAVLGLAGGETAQADGSVGATEDFDWNKAREFWSFRAPQAQPLPRLQNKRWPRERMDIFVLAAMEKQGLAPSPEAERRALIRRVAFDLTGLPPTPEETRAFLADSRADAYERLVARLLASPSYGERMASLWLNVARYAEDQAHQVGDDTKSFYPNAWRYRSWVIGAFNRDLPYDQFIKLQLAADKLDDNATNATGDLAALGFIGLGPKYYNRNRLDVMADEWEDRVDTVTRSFLGLTVACARCHDHKYDPITMRDYYALAGVFASTRLVDKMPNGTIEEAPKESKDGDGKKVKPMLNPDAMHVVDDGEKAQDLNVFIRGNVERKGPVAERRFLQVLCQGEPRRFTAGSGREELAESIASRANPLTARVMVNRVWTVLFGRGLVGTPSNFGSQGQRPTHPELLDDLAVRFMDNGWSVKALVREMVLSATYRQSSRLDAGKQAIDADNTHLWRMNRRRLPIEMWRDSILTVSGELDPGDGHSLELDDPANKRRTVYARISRLKLNDMLVQFDYPDANVHAEKRSVTTTATQKLFVLNSAFMLAEARALAAGLTARPNEGNRRRVERAYQLLYGRPATSEETKLALDFLGKAETPEMPRWQQYAQMLLAANEMFYVD